MARCFAVAINQAPGFSGTPDFGHCSRAATRASWAKSSAKPMSRTMRVRLAMSLGDSMRQTASMEPWMSIAGIAIDHTRLSSLVQADERWFTCANVQALTAFSALLAPPKWRYWSGALALFGSCLHFLKTARGLLNIRRKICELLHLTNLDELVVGHGTTLRPFNRFSFRPDLNHPVAADYFFGFSKGAIGHLGLASGERDTRAHRRGMQAIQTEQHARVLQGFVVFHHRCHLL